MAIAMLGAPNATPNEAGADAKAPGPALPRCASGPRPSEARCGAGGASRSSMALAEACWRAWGRNMGGGGG